MQSNAGSDGIPGFSSNRNLLERAINCLKEFHSIATRYEKQEQLYSHDCDLLHLVMIKFEKYVNRVRSGKFIGY